MGLTRRLLALSQVMPPLVYPRSMQVSRTLKALGTRGWVSHVVTATPDSMLTGIQDPTLGMLYDGQYRLVPIEPREAVKASSSWLRIEREINPQADIDEDNWLRRAEWAMRWQLWTRRYHAMVTFAQPWSDHAIGLAIRRKVRSIPWVAHFSDPWVDSPYIKREALPPGRFELWQEQERAVAELADALIFVTKETADLVMSKYPASWRDKVHVVPHSYDPDLMKLLPPPASSARLRIIHTGSLYAGMRMPTALLEAMAEINRATPLGDILQMDFVGYAPADCADLAASLGIDGFVKFYGRTTYIQSLEAARSADLVLVIDAPLENSVFMPSKIVDYLMLRKPILGLTPDGGVTAQILHRCGHVVVAPDDKQSIKRLLEQAIDRHGKQEPLGDDGGAEARSYDMNLVTAGVERALDAAIARQKQR